MRLEPATLWIWFASACALMITGGVLLRASRATLAGWLVLGAGMGALGLQVLGQVSGRLGPENLWFRSPSFYPAAMVLLGAVIWWLVRPAKPALRFGLPVAVAVMLGAALLLGRLDGRSAPLAMLVPTRDQPAPELTWFDERGQVRQLSELRGKAVLLNFWATWCTPCRREMPLLSSMQREHADDGLVVLYVSLEEPDVLAEFLARHRFDGIHGRLDRAAEFYDAGKYYPLSYLISRDGRVTARWSGRPKEDWLRSEIARTLAGRSADAAGTRTASRG